MLLFLRLAQRNVFRNRIRTVVSLMAIAVGCIALIVNGGIVFNIFRELREDAIRGRHGHLQIYRSGYSEHHLSEPERYLMSPAEAQRVLTLTRATPGVLRVTRRREFSGLISNVDRRAPFLGLAVEPQEDGEFSRHTSLRAGAPLSATDPYGVLAGLGLSQKLDGKPGDVLVLMTTTDSGALNALHVSLRGTFESGLKEYDDWALKVPLPALEHLLQDDRTEQIAVLVKATDDLKVVRAELENTFRREGLDVETRSWEELALFHNQVVNLFGRELSIIRLIIAAVVILGIGNSIGMSIVERSVELAALRAIGLRARAIALLLVSEAFLMGLMGALTGVATGIVVAWIVSAIGIPYPSPPGSTRPFLGGIDVVPMILVDAFTLSVIATLLASVFPIWRAMRLPIASTLRRT